MRHLRGAWALASLDLRMWRRMPLAVVCALVPPLGMALLLVVLTLTVTQQPVALVVQSQGLQADRMAKLIRSDDEAYALTLTGMPQAQAMLKNQEVAAIITIPPDFDQAVTTHTARLELTLNNIDIDFADDIRRSVERSVGQFDALSLGHEEEKGAADNAGETSQPEPPAADKPQENGAPDSAAAVPDSGQPATGEAKKADSDQKEEAEDSAEADTKDVPDISADLPNAYHINVEEHDLRITNVDFLHYQVLPVLILLVLSVGLTGTALLCAADGERGTARLLALAPVAAWVLVAGRLLGGLIASLAALAVALGVCIFTHVIAPPADHWPALAALFICTALCASGMGAMLGTLMRGQRNIAMAATILATYLFFLGGGFTTIAYLPVALRTLSLFNPIRYAIDGMRQALFYPDLTGLPTDLMVLIGASFAAVLLGSLLVLRSWKA